MYYVMHFVDGVPVRSGRFGVTLERAKRLAERKRGWVEQYGVGVIWLPPRRAPH